MHCSNCSARNPGAREKMYVVFDKTGEALKNKWYEIAGKRKNLAPGGKAEHRVIPPPFTPSKRHVILEHCCIGIFEYCILSDVH